VTGFVGGGEGELDDAVGDADDDAQAELGLRLADVALAGDDGLADGVG
jgi:hypothetical protein